MVKIIAYLRKYFWHINLFIWSILLDLSVIRAVDLESSKQNHVSDRNLGETVLGIWDISTRIFEEVGKNRPLLGSLLLTSRMVNSIVKSLSAYKMYKQYATIIEDPTESFRNNRDFTLKVLAENPIIFVDILKKELPSRSKKATEKSDVIWLLSLQRFWQRVFPINSVKNFTSKSHQEQLASLTTAVIIRIAVKNFLTGRLLKPILERCGLQEQNIIKYNPKIVIHFNHQMGTNEFEVFLNENWRECQSIIDEESAALENLMKQNDVDNLIEGILCFLPELKADRNRFEKLLSTLSILGEILWLYRIEHSFLSKALDKSTESSQLGIKNALLKIFPLTDWDRNRLFVLLLLDFRGDPACCRIYDSFLEEYEGHSESIAARYR